MEVDSLSPPAMSDRGSSSVELEDLLVPAEQLVSDQISPATFLRFR